MATGKGNGADKYEGASRKNGGGLDQKVKWEKEEERNFGRDPKKILIPKSGRRGEGGVKRVCQCYPRLTGKKSWGGNRVDM